MSRPNPKIEALVRDRLVDWFDRGHRDLPWRRTRDPYAIWVSEVMLQQTRVETVIGYYERWMCHFPTVRAVARAPLDEVLRQWAGLGYYSRARNLHRAAQQIVSACDGHMPRTAGELQTLPGIGRYTAGAIASIAFGQAAPVVDGNVARVFARLFLMGGRDAIWVLATALVPSGQAASSFNQAIMELGATVCTPRKPMCSSCPLTDLCQAHRRGIADRIPLARPSKKVPRVRVAVAVLERRSRFLLVQRPLHGLWGGLWEFPTVELRPKESALAAATRAAREHSDLRVRFERSVTLHEHGLTHRHFSFFVVRGVVTGGRLRNGPSKHRWLGRLAVNEAAISAATREILKKV